MLIHDHLTLIRDFTVPYCESSRNGPALASVGNVREKFPKLSSLSPEPQDIDQEPEP